MSNLQLSTIGFFEVQHGVTRDSILESPLSTADAMRDIQILLRNCRNGHVQISFQTRIFLQN